MKKTDKDEKDPKKQAAASSGSSAEETKNTSASEEKAPEAASEDIEATAFERELCDLKDRYMRLLAEYDNFRKRTQKEKEALYTDCVSDVVKEWLPVVDNLERALAFQAKSGEETPTPSDDGADRIYRQALEILTKFEIEEIPCEIGSPFDPNLHAAVMHIEDESLGDQCIAQVFLKGYRKADKILRHTMVQVAN